MAHLSDDSDFYGDETYARKLKTAAESTNLEDYWKNRSRDINVIAQSGRSTQKTRDGSDPADTEWPKPKEPKGGLYNCYEGRESAWQLHETTNDFVERLPVTGSSWVGPWLWCANPYANREDEPETQHAEFMQRAPRLLSGYMEKKRQITEKSPNAAPATITRKLKLDRDQLKQDILSLAKESGMTCGKWMLFPAEEYAPGIWKSVVDAVIKDRLGVAAKIATDGSTRLICIYTKDFTEEEDVRRVLLAMKKLDLLPDETSNRHVYYKCDAYTYLDISSSNDYGLQASLYSSKDMLAGDTAKDEGKYSGGKKSKSAEKKKK